MMEAIQNILTIAGLMGLGIVLLLAVAYLYIKAMLANND